jgi:putative hydrolase of the HAD superfamily
MIRALSFDLDDTLWPIAPVIAQAERRLHAWLHEQVPHLAPEWPLERMRELRDLVAARHPEIAHDYGEQRRRSLRVLLAQERDCERLVEDAFCTFYAARNDVTLYADAADSLGRLGARYRLASLSNGNADLERIGLAHHFEQRVSARDAGVLKPDPMIFERLCAALALAPAQVAHIGDDPELDVLGAKRAGLFAIWLNREHRDWPHAEAPDLIVHDLHQLCARLDAQQSERPGVH